MHSFGVTGPSLRATWRIMGGMSGHPRCPWDHNASWVIESLTRVHQPWENHRGCTSVWMTYYLLSNRSIEMQCGSVIHYQEGLMSTT